MGFNYHSISFYNANPFSFNGDIFSLFVKHYNELVLNETNVKNIIINMLGN